MKPAVHSLRQRLLLAIIAPLLLIFAISAVLDFQLARETADKAFDQSLVDAVLDIASHIQTENADLTVALSAEAEAMVRSDSSDTIYFAVHDRQGRLLAGDGDLHADAGPGVGDPHFLDSQLRGKPIRVAVHRIDSPYGSITITVAETLNKRNQASRRILTAMILPTLAVILATLLAVYFGVRRGLAPIEHVEGEIARRSPRDLHEIEASNTPREIQPLLARLNELFGLLREAAASQQRFLADAAHQLRTPLAGLQTQIDLASAEGRFDPEPERLQRINEATGRIGHLIGQLLTYVRTEPTTYLSQSFEPVALHDLVEQSASIFLDQALSKEIDLGFEAGQATVAGIPWMLREALANLIDNALRYTPRGGVVTVSSFCRATGCALTVEDNGPGIPIAERQQIFERFYRIQDSTGDGCGLGLAIVKEIAALHGGEIRLEEPDGGGIRFVLAFPLTPASFPA
jgi:two-component system, OmpR family, sensor histidine kinase TctE